MLERHTHEMLGFWPLTRPGRLVLSAAAGALLLATAACNDSRQASPNQPAAGSYGSSTSGAAPNVSPDNPAYSESGAPRAGQPSGTNAAGAPNPSGNYAPLEHKGER